MYRKHFLWFAAAAALSGTISPHAGEVRATHARQDYLREAREVLGASAAERVAELASRSGASPWQIAFDEPRDKTARPRVQAISGRALGGDACSAAGDSKLAIQPSGIEKWCVVSCGKLDRLEEI